jgi:hypothetical protein
MSGNRFIRRGVPTDFEPKLGRALVLMVLGTAITAAMIGFNAKREAILQRIRIMRADLATWD